MHVVLLACLPTFLAALSRLHNSGVTAGVGVGSGGSEKRGILYTVPRYMLTVRYCPTYMLTTMLCLKEGADF